MLGRRYLLSGAVLFLLLLSPAQAGTTIPLTVNLSESVTVTGTPRVAVDVGGVTRYATYTSGSGTNALTFTLSPQAGDVDLDGITVSSPIDLNGGTMKDAAGNNAVLTFTPPNTSGIKVNYPSLGMDFVYDADGRYSLNGTVYNDLTSFLAASGGTFTRASVGTYFDSTGTLQTAASGTPRFDYDPVTHAAKGILIEESRANLVKYSSDYAYSGWSKTRSSVSANATIAPDGNNTAFILAEDTTVSNTHALQGPLITFTASPYTVSVFLKPKEKNWALVRLGASSDNINAYFDLQNGVIGSKGAGTTSTSILALPNGWYRCSVTGTSSAVFDYSLSVFTAVSNGNVTYNGDGSSGIYMWGAQVEQGSFATSYIPTTSAAVTRVADTLKIPTGAWYNATEGGVFSTAAVGSTTSGGQPAVFSLDDNTANNRIQLRRNNGPNTLTHVLSAAGTTLSVQGGSTSMTTGTSYKMSFGYKSGANQTYMNGSAQTSYLTASAMPSVTQLQLGYGTNATYLGGWISAVKYYPALPSNTQLQLLTQ